MRNPVTILSTGKYLPGDPIPSDVLDRKINKPFGWVEKKSGIRFRHYAGSETTSQMGAKAARQAIAHAKLNLKDIDCIISCGAGPEQIIPATSTIIQRELGLGASGIPCFDVNMTCLGFIAGLDVASRLVNSQYKNILLIISEIPSITMNWEDMETCTIFGDGAAAAVISDAANTPYSSAILAYQARTFGDAASCCEYRGSGTRYHPNNDMKNFLTNNMFRMDGKTLVKIVMRHLPQLVDETLAKAQITRDDIDLCIPHQASNLGMKLVPKLLSMPEEKIMNVYATNGNQVAASIPIALHEAIQQKRIKRGDKILLVGTAAGVSLGVMILEY